MNISFDTTVTIKDVDIECLIEADYQANCDYGVPGSPVWNEAHVYAVRPYRSKVMKNVISKLPESTIELLEEEALEQAR